MNWVENWKRGSATETRLARRYWLRNTIVACRPKVRGNAPVLIGRRAATPTILGYSFPPVLRFRLSSFIHSALR